MPSLLDLGILEQESPAVRMQDAASHVTVFHEVEIGFSNILWSTQPLDRRCLGEALEGLLGQTFHRLRQNGPRRD